MLLSPPLQLAVQPSAHNTALLHRLTRGHVLTIAPDSLGGLLLVKSFYVDFAGPGAAVGGGFDQACTAVYAIGQVHLQTVLTPAERQSAIDIRIAYSEQLSAIVDRSQPHQRAHLITRWLAEWLPGNLSLMVSAELAAGLAGVLPNTVRMAWQTEAVA